MVDVSAISRDIAGLHRSEIEGLMDLALGDAGKYKKVLLVPPDFTRYHSGAGFIAGHIYRRLSPYCRVDVLPALGTHVRMSAYELVTMYPGIPLHAFCVHDHRNDVVKIGEVGADFVRKVSDGLMDAAIPVEVNRLIMDESYDLILSIGQVVPHEVVGMANRNKNLFVGCGGRGMINASHMLGALYGLERVMGRDFSPVRKVFDYAEQRFLMDRPVRYALTVTTAPDDEIRVHGLFIGRDRAYFERAVALSQELNITLLDEPVDAMICRLDDREFKSSWVGNKAIYRTRMALRDGGKLIVLAPGVERFGEDQAVDRLIRKYGFRGRDTTLEAAKLNADLKDNLSVAAHLIHASAEGRFTVVYCSDKLSRQEIEDVGFEYIPYREAVKRYAADRLVAGYNTLPDGQRVYYIDNPALGLWAERARFEGQ